jgi:hypothetical protein
LPESVPPISKLSNSVSSSKSLDTVKNKIADINEVTKIWPRTGSGTYQLNEKPKKLVEIKFEDEESSKEKND